MAPLPARDVLVVLRVPRSLALPSSDALATLRHAAALASTRLTVLLPAFGDVDRPAPLFHALQRLLSAIYTECAKELSKREDMLLLPVDVVVEDLLLRCGGSAFGREGFSTVLECSYNDVEGGCANPSRDPATQAHVRTDISPSNEDLGALYGTTAMGGTFDHLHSGHKILLTMAAWISERRVIVGMTDDALLGKKANRHLLEPLCVASSALEVG